MKLTPPSAPSDSSPWGAILAADWLLDTLPWAVLVVDEQRIVRRINQQATRWCGMPPEVLLGQPLAEAGLPPALHAPLQQLLETGEAMSHEAFLPQVKQWVCLTATRQPGGWIIYGHDITPQKQREQQYLALAENTPDALTRWTPDLRLRYANAAFAAVADAPLPGPLGHTSREMGQSENLAGPYMAALQRVFDTGQPQEHFTQFATPQGEAYYHSRLVPELHDGEIETVLGIAHDVTTLRQAEQAAQHSRDLLQSVFEAVPHSIVVLEAVRDEHHQVVDFRYQLTNGVADRHMGLELQGRLLRHLLPGYLDDENTRLLIETVETGQPNERTHHYDSLGGPLWLHSRYRKLGECVVLSHEDVTANRQAEQAALRLRDELTQRATDKYHALLYTMDQGFCLLEVLFDAAGQQAVDFRYLELNPVFAEQARMPADTQGKTIRELTPDLEPFWFDTYGRVALTGEPVRLEHHVPQVNRWFDTHAFRVGAPEARQVAVLFTDITARKHTEAALQQAAEADAFRLQLADALGPLTDPVAIQEAVTHTARLHFGADRCYYCEIEGGQAIIRCGAATAGLPSVVGTYPLADFAQLQAVIEAGRPFIVPDVRQNETVDENLRQLCVQLQVISCLNVPVIKNGQAVGVLCLGQRVPREWTDTEVALAAEVAERTWVAVERARIEVALRVGQERQAFLVQLGDALRTVPQAAEVQAVAARLLGEHLHANQAHYGETQGDYVVIHQGYGNGLPAMVGRFWSPAFGEKLTATHRAGIVQVVRDTETDEANTEAERQVLRQARIGAYITVPLLKAGEWVATLDVQTTTPRLWTDEEVQLVEDVAERTWAAVERTRAEEALAASEEKYRSLFNSIDEGFVIGALLYDEQGRPVDALMLETNPSYDRITQTTGTAGRRALEVFPASESTWFEAYARVLATGESLRLENYFKPIDHWIEMYISRVGGAGSHRFASVFSDITARKRHEANLAFLAEVSEDLARLTRMDATMSVLCEKIGRYFGAGVCAFSPVDEVAGTVAIQYVWHRADAHSPAGVYRLAEYYSAEVLEAMRAGQPEIVRDTATGPADVAARLAALPIGAFVNLPLVLDGIWLFVLSITASEPRDWREEEIDLMRELTTRIWNRIERARAEEATHTTEERYLALFNSIEQGVCTLEVVFDEKQKPLDYRFLEVSPSFERQTGIQNGAGRWMREISPEHDEFWFETYGRIALTGQSERFESYSTPLGRWWSVYAFRVQDPALRQVSALFFDITDRKQIEAALRKSEEQLRSFVIASSDALYRMTADWQQMLQLEGKGFLADTKAPHGTWLETYIPPADQAAVGAAMQKAIAGPHFFELEHRVVRADGSIGWTFSRAVPVLGERGELLEWFGTATDITARKEAAEALQFSEQRQRVLIENLPGAAVFIVSRALRYQLAEGEALRQVGYEPVDFQGRTVQEMVSPGQWPTYQALYEGALAGRAFEHEHEQGGRLFLTRAVPLPGPAGEVEAVLAVSYDITVRRAAEEALQVSEAKYRALFETMDQGFGVGEVLPAGPGRAADFRWLEANPQVERLTGMPQSAILSGETMRTVMPQLEDTWYEHYERVALTGEPVRFEQHAQALGRWFDVYAYPLDGPAPHRIALLFTNITARKQAEEALRLAEESHRAELEQQVVQRTQQLQENRDLLRSVLDTSLISMSVLHAVRDEAGQVLDFRIDLVNRELERQTQRTDLVGKLYTVEYPGVRLVGIFDLMLQALANGQPQGMEYFYEHEGFHQWFSCQFLRMGDALVATNLDITERKAAEQERLRNLRLLEQAEAVANLGSWDYNLLDQQFLWSDGMYQLFGLPLGQPVSPEIYLQYVVDEDRPQAERLVAGIRLGTGNFEETLRLQVGEEVKTVRVKVVVLYDEANQPVRVLGVDLNISELQRLEADNLRLRLTQQQALFEAVQAAQEAERKRMAESLHNGIGQILYATKLHLDRLHVPLLGADPVLVGAHREANQLLSEAIRQTRALSHELVPMVLEEFGLAVALQDIGRKMSTPQLRLHSHVLLDEAAAPLVLALQMALYRMAQELAQNIVKHAHGATEASLELETMPGWVLLRAEDNGAGFAPPAPDESFGLGLRSIRDRVTLLGGQLETGSAPTSGAYVRIRIPLPVSPVS